MKLDDIVGAIDAGEDGWAERLGLTLAIAAESGEARQEQWLRRERTKTVAARPSYLVSWLMTVAA